jgi:type 1 fimbriae regulatory protein FimB/type 1 fimbriae regulatory protein FimE
VRYNCVPHPIKVSLLISPKPRQPKTAISPSKKGVPSTKRKRNSPPDPPAKPRNADVRSREYLTKREAIALREAANIGRHATRNCLLIMMMYRHGLRVSEATDLQWDQVHFDTATLHVARRKNGDPSVQPIEGDELRSLRKLQREQQPPSRFIFCSNRNAPLSPRAVHTIVATAGIAARIKFPVHPHMLRHARGFRLAEDGNDTRAIQAYLGHKNIQHTVLYTKLDPKRFKGFGRD